MKNLTHFIAGAHVKGTSARFGDVFDPATGEVQARVPFANRAELTSAVEAAQKALPEWAALNPQRRARVMFNFKALIEKNMDALATLLSSEHGKVIADSKGDIQRGLEVIEFACGIPHLTKGEFTEGAGPGIDVYSIRQPLGVVAGITPFNFPGMIPLWMCTTAIAAGNAFVLKPSEKDPSAALFLARLWKDAGLPDGVFTVLNGDVEAVDAILTHPDIAAVSFVGSTPVAKYIYETGTAHGKRVQALGGAKNHMVVLPDAELDAAADAAVSAAYGSAGERCMAVSVVVAVGDVADPLVDAIAARLPKLRIGAGTDPESQMGPLITAQHREKVAGYVDRGVR